MATIPEKPLQTVMEDSYTEMLKWENSETRISRDSFLINLATALFKYVSFQWTPCTKMRKMITMLRQQ